MNTAVITAEAVIEVMQFDTAPTIEAVILQMAKELEVYAFDLARSIEPEMVGNLLTIALQLEKFHRALPPGARRTLSTK